MLAKLMFVGSLWGRRAPRDATKEDGSARLSRGTALYSSLRSLCTYQIWATAGRDHDRAEMNCYNYPLNIRSRICCHQADRLAFISHMS